MRGTGPIKSKWVCLKFINLCLQFFIVIIYQIIFMLFIECIYYIPWVQYKNYICINLHIFFLRN